MLDVHNMDCRLGNALPYRKKASWLTVSLLALRHHGSCIGRRRIPHGIVAKEYAVERVCQRLQRALAAGRLQFAFPYGDAVPAHTRESRALFLVTADLALYLLTPEVRIGLRQGIVAATVMPMPETSVDEDYRAILAQDDVGMSRQTTVVDTVAEATSEQILTHKKLRLGVLAAYCRHASAALFGSHLVHGNGYKWISNQPSIWSRLSWRSMACIFLPEGV